MTLHRSFGWKTASMVAACSLIMVAVALAFPPGNPGDTVADNVLGQPDFVHNAANIPDAASLNLSGGLSRIAVDKSVTPNRIYLADSNNSRVLGFHDVTALIRWQKRQRRFHRRLVRHGRHGEVAVLVNDPSADIVIGQADFTGTPCNAFGRTAQSLCNPQGVAVDSAGNLWVADSGNHRVLEYNAPFSQAIKAGFTANVVLGQGGNFTSNCANSCGGPDNANFNDPEGIAIDSGNHLWVADRGNSRVLEFNTPLTSGIANFLIGQPNFTASTCDNPAVKASTLCFPSAVALDTNNNLYVADVSNQRVLEYNFPLCTSSCGAGAGDATADHVWGQAGSFTTSSCNSGGVLATALCNPLGVALDSTNNLYVADSSNNRILEFNETVNPPTNLTANRVFGQAGSMTTNGCNTPSLSATSLCTPQDVALTAGSPNQLLAVDSSNNRALLYTSPLTSQTANVVLGQPDFLHNSANVPDAEVLNGAHGVAVDSLNHLYIVDNRNNRVLAWTSAASFANGAPANLVFGQPDFFSTACNQNTAVSASNLCGPVAVVTDASNNLYISDISNNRVLEFNAPFLQGITKGFSANGVFGQPGFTTNGCNQGGFVTGGTLCQPDGMAIDTHGNLYVADRSNNRVLQYSAPITSGEAASTVFGQPNLTSNTANNGGLSATSLNNPFGVAVDSSNNVYIADFNNQRVLEYNETTNPPSNFTANTVFGQGNVFTTANCKNGGVTAGSLCNPHKVTVDSHNNLYVADNGNNRVLEYNQPLCTSSCPSGAGDTTADRVFGQANSLTSNGVNFGNSGIASPESMWNPVGVALDTSGDLLVGDFSNNRVLKDLQPLATPGVVTLAPSPLKVGNVATNNSKTVSAIATNTGSVPVLLSGATITGTNAGDFAIASNTCTGYINPTKTCTASIKFTPTVPVPSPSTEDSTAAETATLTLFDNAGNANQTDALSGNSATKTFIVPTNFTLAFGNVPHGTTSAAKVVTFSNDQSAAISLSPAPSITSGSPIFAISATTCGASLAAFASCTVSVTCAPASAGAIPNGTLTITDSPDTLSPHAITLTCTGT